MYSFTASGKFRFPTDMLRYDRCYPTNSDSVAQMSFSQDPHYRKVAGKEEDYTVSLASNHKPTEARWKSFRWTITDVVKVKK